MLVIAAFSFACGIYLNAFYDIPLKFLVPPLVLLLIFIPLFIRNSGYLPAFLIIICFILAGMARLSVITIAQTTINSDGGTKRYMWVS